MTGLALASRVCAVQTRRTTVLGFFAVNILLATTFFAVGLRNGICSSGVWDMSENKCTNMPTNKTKRLVTTRTFGGLFQRGRRLYGKLETLS